MDGWMDRKVTEGFVLAIKKRKKRREVEVACFP
jgi:hypothetical protein